MQLEVSIPEEVEGRLRSLAAELGCESVEALAATYLTALVSEPDPSGPERLSEAELAASLEMIDRSMAQIEAGEVCTLEEARESLLRPLQEKTR